MIGNWRWHFVEELLKNDDPLLGAEVGVKEGRFISHMLKSFPTLMMYAVDPWIQNVIEPKNDIYNKDGTEHYQAWDFNDIYARYKDNIAGMEDRVMELKMFSLLAAESVPDNSLDFVFIDAQHNYKSVREDIIAWAPKVKKGGLLSGHDHNEKFPGVVQAVSELYPESMVGRNAVWFTRV